MEVWSSWVRLLSEGSLQFAFCALSVHRSAPHTLPMLPAERDLQVSVWGVSAAAAVMVALR
jgi:hypothetical protein